MNIQTMVTSSLYLLNPIRIFVSSRISLYLSFLTIIVIRYLRDPVHAKRMGPLQIRIKIAARIANNTFRTQADSTLDLFCRHIWVGFKQCASMTDPVFFRDFKLNFLP